MMGDANAEKLSRLEKGALKYCRDHFGLANLKIGQEIHASVKWRPSFHFNKGPIIHAVEVGEILDARIFKLVGNDIMQFTRPITLWLACPLEVVQSDAKQVGVKELKRLGVGILTVDQTDTAELQHNGIPLAQYISEDLLVEKIKGLPSRLKLGIRAAHATFLTTPGQGLQEAGQIVEAIVDSLTVEAIKKGQLKANVDRKVASGKVDALYTEFVAHRAAFGGARSFLNAYRNTASHPARSAKESMKKINSCRNGFFEAIRIAEALSKAAKILGYRLKLHL